MATYAKPKKTRTMEKGLRPLPPQLRDSFPQREIGKMEERIEKILANCQIPDERNSWIIAQALLAAAWREAETNEEKNEIMRKIQKNRDEGHRLGFSQIEIIAINKVVLQKDQTGQLEGFRQRLLVRRKES